MCCGTVMCLLDPEAWGKVTTSNRCKYGLPGAGKALVVRAQAPRC